MLTPLSAAAAAAAAEARAIEQRKREEQAQVGIKAIDDECADDASGPSGQGNKSPRSKAKKKVGDPHELMSNQSPSYGHYIVSM